MRLCFAMLMAGLVFAQSAGRVTGTVVDSSGAAIPGAKVALALPGGAKPLFTAEAGADGIYRFSAIPPQLYDLSCEAQGFGPAVVRGIKVDAGLELAMKPLTMSVAAQAQTVDVSAAAAGIQTENAQVATSLTNEQIRVLPSLDRGLQGLLATQPGVTFNARAETTINGLRPSFTNITFDGINIQDNYIRTNAMDFQPNMLQIDQAAEVTIATSNTDAADGGGVAQIKVAPRSGTNDLHGRLLWNNRNNAVAANPWFANRSGLPKLFLNQNVLGGSLLGPIKKDKLFYSLNFEAIRTREKAQQVRTILRGAARQGIFAYRNTAGVLQTKSLWELKPLTPDTAIKSLLDQLPPESAINRNDFGDGLNTGGYAFAANQNRDRNNGTARVDYNMSPRHSVHGTLSINNDVVDRPDIGTDYVVDPKVKNDNLTKLLSLTYRANIGSSFTNEARFGFNLAPGVFTTSQQFGKALFVLPLIDNPVNDFLAQGRYTNTYAIQDNASWVRGKHFFRAGYQSQRVRINSYDYGGTIPTYGLDFAVRNRFTLAASDLPGIRSTDLDNANGLLALLAGVIENSTQTYNVTSRASGYVAGAPFDRNYRLDNHSIYGSDQWKISNRLSLSLGLRWEYITPVRERDGLVLLPVLENGNPIQTLLNPKGKTDFANQLYAPDRNNFAPNVGLAWQPFGDGKTVIRAGYSVNFVNDEFIPGAENSALTNQGLQAVPFDVGLTTPRAANPPAVPAPKFGVPRTYAENFADNPAANAQAMLDPKLRTPYVQQWNFGVQREIGKALLEVRYLGNKTTKAWRGIDYNQVVIKENGFLADFQRAQSNGNIARARNGVFNPMFSPNLPGSQRLTVFPLLEEGGFLADPTVRQLIQQGQAGQLAYIYKINEIQGDVSFFRNENSYGTNLMTNYSNASYHALQVDWTRRYAGGLMYQFYYTYSKVLSDAEGRSQVRFEPFIDLASAKVERARTSFDQTHTFKLNGAYELPFGKGKRFQGNAAVNQVIGGWTLSGSTLGSSGSPFSVLSSRGTVNRTGRSGNNGATTTLTKPELDAYFSLRWTGDGPVFVPLDATGADGRAVAADGAPPLKNQVFYHPAAGTLGGLQRRWFSGPRYWSTDLALTKSVKIGERQRVDFRAESFNFTNSPSFSIGDQVITSQNFGKIRSTQSDRRVMQFGLYYNF